MAEGREECFIVIRPTFQGGTCGCGFKTTANQVRVFPGAQVCIEYNQHVVPFADSPPPWICCNRSQERARLASSDSSTSAGCSRMQPTLVESFKSQNTPSTHITSLEEHNTLRLLLHSRGHDALQHCECCRFLSHASQDKSSLRASRQEKCCHKLHAKTAWEARVQQQIEGINYFAITTADIWTSCANHSYIGMTVHYVDEAYKLQSHMLRTWEFSDSHAENNYCGRAAVHCVGLEGAYWLSVATTDNGLNIALAMEMPGWPHMPCFSHTLHLAVEDAMKLPEVYQGPCFL